MSKSTNATPKPLNDYGRAKAVAAECRSFLYMHEEPGFPPPNAAWCIGASRALHEASALIEKMLALKAQPAPVPLAEDEAVIAQAGRCCEARGHGGLWPSKENCIVCGLAERLSLRSGQLAQVLALRDWANEAWLATSEDPNEPHRLECPAPVPELFCHICGSRLVARQSGPLPGYPKGILTSICATDPSHASEHSVKPTASVPLAEDESLVAEMHHSAHFELDDCETEEGYLLHEGADRISLRSGQLAQVLALCDDAESTKQAKECVAGGGVICIQVPEIRAAIEGKN